MPAASSLSWPGPALYLLFQQIIGNPCISSLGSSSSAFVRAPVILFLQISFLQWQIRLRWKFLIFVLAVYAHPFADKCAISSIFTKFMFSLAKEAGGGIFYVENNLDWRLSSDGQVVPCSHKSITIKVTTGQQWLRMHYNHLRNKGPKPTRQHRKINVRTEPTD
jgi:hypothetical protein